MQLVHLPVALLMEDTSINLEGLATRMSSHIIL